MRRFLLPGLALLLAALAAVPAETRASHLRLVGRQGRVGGGEIVDLPVSFSVRNVNGSNVPCSPDGKTYTARGHLVAPRRVLAARDRAITVYHHGSGDGDSFHFRAIHGYDWITEMARLGHASLAFDQVSYGTSDLLDGNQICLGSGADITHQIIGKLRTGDYAAAGRAGPRFSRVALGGQSGGGLAVEIEAYSFHDIDALIVLDWGNEGFIPQAAGPLAQFGVRCAQGGEPKRPGAPGGYAYVFKHTTDVIFYNAEPAVQRAFAVAYERDPCGIVGSAVEAVALTNHVLLPTVTVPVLVAFGDHDIFPPGTPEAQRVAFAGTDDLTITTIARSGHTLMLQRTAPAVRALVSNWLLRRGF
jgi:pimeloyl-ACP methyl ester carboxylesterase